MKQIIETINHNRKAALVAAGAVALLLCVFTAVPFAAAAFGTVAPAETEPTGAVDAATHAAALAELNTLRAEAEQAKAEKQELQAQLLARQEELDQANAYITELEQRCTESEAALGALWERYDLLMANHSRKYVIVAKLVQNNLFLDDETRHNLYVTAEEYERIQVDSVLESHPDLDFPTASNWSLTVIDKYIVELEGVE